MAGPHASTRSVNATRVASTGPVRSPASSRCGRRDAATVLAAPRLPHLLDAGDRTGPVLATRVAFTFLVLAWGPAMAFQLGHIGALGAVRLHADPRSLMAHLLPEAGLPLLTVAQAAVALLAGSLAWVCLLGIRGRLRRDGEQYSHAGWRLLQALCGVYVAASLALVLAR